ncbi:uncharacterized protein LOC136075126 isoform X2 [Hydra vulgaris]|uniref:Uncharacterized protein LOC136075126 isoform X2 n=1 Tax=Hydra vulgaris TaxID=6087 RepID=A0ABM4B3W3_HYDVU
MSKIEGQQFPIAEGSQSQLLSHHTGAKRNKNSKKEKQQFPMEEGKYQRKSLRYLVEIRDLLSRLVELSKLKNIGGVDMADCTRNILGKSVTRQIYGQRQRTTTSCQK